MNEWMYQQDEMWNVSFLGILCSESLSRIQGSKKEKQSDKTMSDNNADDSFDS